MTSKPIKTLILDSLKSCIVDVIGSAEKVFVDPARWVHEEITDPYALLLTDAESAVKKDLSSEKTFTAEIHVWVQEDTDDKSREKAILLSAQIQQALLPRSSASRQYALQVEEAEGASHDVLWYQERICVVVARYVIRYRHKYGDPFSLN